MNNDIIVKFRDDYNERDGILALTQAGLNWCELNVPGDTVLGNSWLVSWAHTARLVLMAKVAGLKVGTPYGETL